MRKMIVLVAGIWAAGCVPRTGTFASVADGAATGTGHIAGLNSRVEYAPGQFAAFAWDRTGIYGSLSGTEDGSIQKRLVHVWIYVLGNGPDGNLVSDAKDFLFERETLKLPSVVSQTLLTTMPEDQFRWTTDLELAAELGSYRRDFWISWKAFRLDKPPSRQAWIYVVALTGLPPGAQFRMVK